MSSTAPTQTQTLRSILRNGNSPRATLHIAIPPASTFAATTAAHAPGGTVNPEQYQNADDTPSNIDTPLPSPPLPPPPPPNTPTTGVRFAPAPRHRPSKRRASRALQALPYNGALRPKRLPVPDDAHNPLSVIDQAERSQLRRKRHSSSVDLERAALEAVQTWGLAVWDRSAWDENSLVPDDSTRRGRRHRQSEVVW